MIFRKMEKLQEVLRIVQGNEYPIKIFLEKMGYSGNALRATAIDLRMVDDLAVSAVHHCGFNVPLEFSVVGSGKYLTVTIPDDKKMRFGAWGIRLTGRYDGLRIASAERHVFDIVKWNGESYVPPLLVDGEGSYLLNMKFVPMGIETGNTDRQIAGRIGFAVFDDVSQIDVDSLPSVPNVCGDHTVVNSTNGARMVVVVPINTSLSFTFGGIPVDMDYDEDSSYGYYYTDPQYADSFEVSIS